MKRIKKTLCLLLSIMLFSMTCSMGRGRPEATAAQTYTTGHYRVDTLLNFRSGPSTSYDTLYPSYDSTTPVAVPEGSRILVTKTDGEWGYTYLRGKAGWLNLTYCTFLGSYTELTDKKTTIIDISQWQYDTLFDWNQMKKDGVTGVILRVGGRYANSTGKGAIYEDSRVKQHYENATAAGLDVGLYFFSYALDAAGAKEEAQFCIDKIEEYGFVCTLPIFIDLEDYPPDTSHFDGGKPLNALVIDTFCYTLENAGYYTGLYTNLNFMRYVIDPTILENRCVWYAQYNDTVTYEGRYDIWQYSSTGEMEGYTGGVLDMNTCYRDYPAFIRANGYNGFDNQGGTENPPTEQPDEPDIPVDPPYEGIDVHTHSPGSESIFESTCTDYGSKSVNCTTPGCSALLSHSLTDPTGHTVQKAYIVNASPTAGESIRSYSNVVDFASELDTLNAYNSLTSQGGCLIEYCSVCNKILKSSRLDPFSVCYHEYNMTTAVYKTTSLMYFRTGPTTAFKNVTDANGQDIYIAANAALNIYFTIADWGYTSYNGYSGWIYLPFAAFVSDAQYYYPSAKTASTCIAEGKALYSCRNCNKTTYSVVTPILGHTPGNPVVTPGSCRTYSHTSTYCTVCDSRIRYTVGNLGSHIYNTEVTVEPTGSTYGKANIICYYCNKGGSVTLPSLLMCDSDADGKVNAADARSALRFAVNMDTDKLTSAVIKRLDTDRSGSVNAADARNILRIAVNLTSIEDLLLRYYS